MTGLSPHQIRMREDSSSSMKAGICPSSSQESSSDSRISGKILSSKTQEVETKSSMTLISTQTMTQMTMRKSQRKKNQTERTAEQAGNNRRLTRTNLRAVNLSQSTQSNSHNFTRSMMTKKTTFPKSRSLPLGWRLTSQTLRQSQLWSITRSLTVKHNQSIVGRRSQTYSLLLTWSLIASLKLISARTRGNSSLKGKTEERQASKNPDSLRPRTKLQRLALNRPSLREPTHRSQRHQLARLTRTHPHLQATAAATIVSQSPQCRREAEWTPSKSKLRPAEGKLLNSRRSNRDRTHNKIREDPNRSPNRKIRQRKAIVTTATIVTHQALARTLSQWRARRRLKWLRSTRKQKAKIIRRETDELLVLQI